MKALEALADAIMHFEGWGYGTRSWRNRNPGNLRPVSKDQEVDEDGYCVFHSLSDGWAALKIDLMHKFNGSHGLTSSSTLLDLLNIYAPAGDHNNPNAYATFIANTTSKILGRVITTETTLNDFNQ